ncbi:MAG: hypothetical protein Q9219_002998 [cf. Caloplaca sp. 3 TL-2023]
MVTPPTSNPTPDIEQQNPPPFNPNFHGPWRVHHIEKYFGCSRKGYHSLYETLDKHMQREGLKGARLGGLSEKHRLEKLYEQVLRETGFEPHLATETACIKALNSIARNININAAAEKKPGHGIRNKRKAAVKGGALPRGMVLLALRDGEVFAKAMAYELIGDGKWESMVSSREVSLSERNKVLQENGMDSEKEAMVFYSRGVKERCVIRTAQSFCVSLLESLGKTSDHEAQSYARFYIEPKK